MSFFLLRDASALEQAKEEGTRPGACAAYIYRTIHRSATS